MRDAFFAGIALIALGVVLVQHTRFVATGFVCIIIGAIVAGLDVR